MLFRKLFNRLSPFESIPQLHINRLSSYSEYLKYISDREQEYTEIQLTEQELIISSTRFTVLGYCYICNMETEFLVDFNYSYKVNGRLTPNWRERLVCPYCKLINRMRASIHIFEKVCRPMSSDKIYISEQTTPLYLWLSNKYKNITGSEYLGDSIAFGQTNHNGIRNESFNKLTFGDGEFDFILSFDVFEHIPDYKKAFRECFRCLRPGGKLLFSVPFRKDSYKNIVRAHLTSEGTVEHLLPPEYHGDPINSKGCLCFYHFGWVILDQLLEIGFNKTNALMYWSRALGYIGGEQIQLIAYKYTG